MDVFLERVHYGRLAILSVAFLVVPFWESTAQADWQRTVKVIAPVEQESVVRALTDSAVAMAEAKQLPIQRSPDSDTTTSPQQIEEALSKEGLAMTSATHVFLTYQFLLENGELQRDILSLHFIYRPTAEQGEDISIFFVDLSKNDLYHELLVESGTPSPVNEVVYEPFGEQLSFQKMQDTATIVQVGNEIIRDTERAEAKKRRLLQTIRRLTYN